MARARARLLRDAADADVPVLGICFGAQMLARALGGRALSSDQPEIGWLEVRTDGLGLQFHPEATPEIAASWLASARERLVSLGVDPDALLDRTWELAGASRAAAWQLFDRYLELIRADG